MSIEQITSFDELEMKLNKHNKLMFLKNSTTCPISAEAFRVFTKAADELHSNNWYYLNVQESRELSNQIAEKFNVKHESPQTIYFEDGKVAWHTSHWDITLEKLEQIWTKERKNPEV